jgi:hypothetical protein
LPWSTANEDLVELFETTGQVELAEILFEGTRSKGCGVVQFSQIPEAETAIGNWNNLFFDSVWIIDSNLILSEIPGIYVWRSAFGCVGCCRNPEVPLIYQLSDVRFNDRWHTFSPSAAKGGQVAPMQSEGM